MKPIPKKKRLIICLLALLYGCTTGEYAVPGGRFFDEWVPIELAASLSADLESCTPPSAAQASKHAGGKSAAGTRSYSYASSKLVLESVAVESRSVVKARAGSWDPSGGASASWAANDQVGLYLLRSDGVADASIDRRNVLYTAASASSSTSLTTAVTPRLFFPPSTATPISLYGYFPYSSASGDDPNNLPYTTPVNQSSLAARQAADILVAKSTGLVKTTPSVTLTFFHTMTLMTFAIKTNAPESMVLTKVALTGSGISGGGTIDFSAWKVYKSPTAFSPYALVNHTLGSTSVYVDLIINYVDLGSNIDGAELALELTINGSVRRLPLGANKKLDIGERHVYAVTAI